jgi:hypothetical protein
LAEWRKAGLIHGDIKPDNVVVELCAYSQSATFLSVRTFLIDVESVVEMPVSTNAAGQCRCMLSSWLTQASVCAAGLGGAA